MKMRTAKGHGGDRKAHEKLQLKSSWEKCTAKGRGGDRKAPEKLQLKSSWEKCTAKRLGKSISFHFQGEYRK